MNKFENEVFEDTNVPGVDTEELDRQRITEAEKYAQLAFDKETGEVIEERKMPSVRLLKQPKKRIKRTEAEMIAALGGSALKEATYVAERVSKLEEKITELLGSVSQKAREHILNDFPHLSRY